MGKGSYARSGGFKPLPVRRRIVVRTLAQQYGASDRKRIQELIDGFGELRFRRSGYHYPLYELRRCLAAGLLFPALHVAAALLERFLRDMLVYREVKRQSRLHRLLTPAMLWEQLEDAVKTERKNFGDIRALALKLRGKPLGKKDVKAIERFNHFVRIPLLHGQVRRFVEAEWPESDDIWASDLEDAVDARAIPSLGFVLDIMRRYEDQLPGEAP